MDQTPGEVYLLTSDSVNSRLALLSNKHTHTHTRMHIHTTVLQPSWILSGATQVSQYQKDKTRKVKPIWIYWSKRCTVDLFYV